MSNIPAKSLNEINTILKRANKRVDGTITLNLHISVMFNGEILYVLQQTECGIGLTKTLYYGHDVTVLFTVAEVCDKIALAFTRN